MNSTTKNINYKVLISTGEASGDLHAANLVKAVRENNPQIEFYGMGGKLMREASVQILANIQELAIIGGLGIITNFNKVLKMMRIMRQALKTIKPDLLILVDYPGFNLWLAKIAKNHGIKVLYYISPQIWAWRQNRVKKIRRRVDMMAVVFPFEVSFYKKAQVPVTFVGHPLLKNAKPTMSVNLAKQTFKLNLSKQTVGLFPGSRNEELKYILPTILQAAKLSAEQQPNIQFILPLASSLDHDIVAAQIKEANLPFDIKIITSNIYDIIQVCDAIITVSGTVTLEIALSVVPMIIIYKMAPLNYCVIRALNLVKIPYIGLPNIIAETKIVPELIQNQASATNIADTTSKILQDESYRNNMITDLAEVHNKLKSENADKNIAELVLEML